MSLRSRARRLQRKTGLSYQQALARLRERARLRQPIPVVELAPLPRDAELQRICEQLVALAAAKSLVLANCEARILVHVGLSQSPPVSLLAPVRGPAPPPTKPLSPPFDEPRAYELGDGTAVFSTPVGDLALLTITFDARTSLGLVRLRAREAIDALLPLLSESPNSPVGGTGSNGDSGAPAETFAGHVRDRN